MDLVVRSANDVLEKLARAFDVDAGYLLREKKKGK